MAANIAFSAVSTAVFKGADYVFDISQLGQISIAKIGQQGPDAGNAADNFGDNSQSMLA